MRLPEIVAHVSFTRLIGELRYPVVLASTSPRRIELLASLTPAFEVLASGVDEVLDQPDPKLLAEELARRKAAAVAALRPDALVIGADTVVSLHGVIYGKPESFEMAVETLERLSGRAHSVITGVALASPEGLVSFVEETQVTFRELTRQEIGAYVRTGEPMDKAGGYAIQGGAAGFAVAVDGDLDCVVGLPIGALARHMAAYRIPDSPSFPG